jgi:dipeptidyl aminopeptidase/acylaminoacyl peptidase
VSSSSGSDVVRDDLVVLNLSTMEEHVILSNIFLNAFAWSPDGNFIAYSARADSGIDYYIVDSEGGSPSKVSNLPRQSACCGWQMPSWDSTGRFFYFVFQGALWRTSIAGRQSEKLTQISDHRITNRIWTTDGTLWTTNDDQFTIVVARNDQNEQDEFYRIDLHTGVAAIVRDSDECYSCKWPSVDVGSYVLAGLPKDEHFVYVAEASNVAPDIWISDSDGRTREQLTHLNPQLEKYDMGRGRIVEWLSDDGDRLHGALLLPPDYEQGKRYPLVVWVYPELQSHHVNQFGFGQFPGPFNMQLFATRGYAVFLPDVMIPGKGEWSASLAKSVLPGVNKIVEMGIADSTRVGIMGHSYGGWSVLTLISQTRRFKVAVECDGVGDFIAWQGMLGNDGSAHGLAQAKRVVLGGSLWQMPMKYLEHSPILFLDHVETPLLIVHGAQDDAAPAFLGDEVFVGLRQLEKEAEYVKYADEGHVPSDWSLSDQRDLAGRLISWVDAHLKAGLVPRGSSQSNE